TWRNGKRRRLYGEIRRRLALRRDHAVRRGGGGGLDGAGRPGGTDRLGGGGARCCTWRAGWAERTGWVISAGLLDLAEEFRVGGGIPGLVQQELHGLLGVEAAERAAQRANGPVLVRSHDQLVAAGAGGHRVDGGKDAPLGQVTAESQ